MHIQGAYDVFLTRGSSRGKCACSGAGISWSSSTGKGSCSGAGAGIGRGSGVGTRLATGRCGRITFGGGQRISRGCRRLGAGQWIGRSSERDGGCERDGACFAASIGNDPCRLGLGVEGRAPAGKHGFGEVQWGARFGWRFGWTHIGRG